MDSRVARLRNRVVDGRAGRVVFLSHCLLNHNVRYLGGADPDAGVDGLVDEYLSNGVGICQMPCPEQRAWGGVLKRRMLLAYGAKGTWRAPVVKALLPAFVSGTRVVYRRLAAQVASQVLDYQRSGCEVVAVVGIGGSPSCGVRTTLDLPAAVDSLIACPLAQLDAARVRDEAVDAHAMPGRGLFVEALRQRLDGRAKTPVPFVEHDFTQVRRQQR